MDSVRRIIVQLHDSKRHLQEMRERADVYRYRFRNKVYLQSVQDGLRQDQERIERQREKIERAENLINSIEDETTRKIVSLRSMGKSWVAVSIAVEMSEHGAVNRFNRACEDLAIPFAANGLIDLLTMRRI